MNEMPILKAADYRARIGEDIGVSTWIEITQAMIDTFAETTFDPQFIHVDPERAKAEGPFDTTIAHGFLILSLLIRMGHEARPAIAGAKVQINYGFDKVRFLNPVPSGARVRGHFKLISAEERKSGETTFSHEVTVEIEGSDRPALVAEFLTRLYYN